MNYEQEAKGDTLKGTINLGARSGYDSQEPKAKEFSLEDVVEILNKINSEFASQELQRIPCIVREGLLVGRTETENYRERIYSFEFLWSPRAEPMQSDVFYNALLEYGKALGEKMQQQRLYLEFNGSTEVWKLKESE